MKLVIQRVKSAKVVTDGEVVGQIGKGLFILFCVKNGDSESIVNPLVEKVVNMRLMPDENLKMNFSVLDANAEILVVSQFTLYSNTTGGRRPSFLDAAEPEVAKNIYEKFIEELKAKGLKVETGNFGNYMDIKTDLDGPVTIILES